MFRHLFLRVQDFLWMRNDSSWRRCSLFHFYAFVVTFNEDCLKIAKKIRKLELSKLIQFSLLHNVFTLKTDNDDEAVNASDN